MSGKLVECPRQSRGSGVTASEEHGDELITEDFTVAGEACEGVQEGVAFFRFGLGG